MWTYVYRVTGHAADADDIVQDAFIRILNAGLPGLLAWSMPSLLRLPSARSSHPTTMNPSSSAGCASRKLQALF